MSDIVVAGKHGFQVVTKDAWVFEEDKEIAWAGAKDQIVIRPDMGWIVSRLVDLSPPEDLRPNENGHIFTLADGELTYPTVRDTPLNWLHHDRLIVGHNVDVELLYHVPTDGEASTDLVEPPGAHTETLAAFYRSIYPEHWKKVKDAHSAGLLHSSMECRPDSVTCKLDGCCGQTFPFKGVWSTTYCDSMQKPGREFILNNPLFLGSAVVVPPHRPGWRNANAVEVATWVERNLDEAGQLYKQITAAHEDSLDDEQIEAIMAALLDAAGVGDGNGGRSRVSFSIGNNGDFHFSVPTDLALPTLHQVRRLGDAPSGRIDQLEDKANHQGVIVAFVPPPEIASALAAMGGEPVDQIHVTLAFIADSGGNDTIEGPEGTVTQERLNAVVAVFAASERPLPATVSGLGRFNAPGESEVTYASIDAPGLNEFRTRLVEYLHAAGVPVSMDHGFTPHATLLYHAPGQGPTELPDELAWEIDAIELWWGDDLHAAHGLGGVDDIDQVAATLVMNAIEGLEELDLTAEVVLLDFVASARTGVVQAVLDSGPPEAVATFIKEALDRKLGDA